MTDMTKKIKQNEWQHMLHLVRDIQPELLRNFVNYWARRKSNLETSSAESKEIKSSNSDLWLHMIEANQRLRDLYGEEKADKLIEIIKKTNFLI